MAGEIIAEPRATSLGIRIYALLLDPRADLRDLQLTRLKAGAEPQVFAEALRLVAFVQALPDTHRLPPLDLAMPAMRQMSRRQHLDFRAQVVVVGARSGTSAF